MVFSLTSEPLADDLYEITVVATDNDGVGSLPFADTVRLGPEPPETAPELSEISAQASGQCVTVSGTVVDVNQDLDSVLVAFANGDVIAAVTGTAFSAEQCDLPGGDGSAQVTATDLTGLNDSASVTFAIDAGATATLDSHITAGRLDYTAYANCYLEYGSSTPSDWTSTVSAAASANGATTMPPAWDRKWPVPEVEAAAGRWWRRQLQRTDDLQLLPQDRRPRLQHRQSHGPGLLRQWQRRSNDRLHLGLEHPAQ
ncbi:hypothetical protein [Microbulbifer taiwanensis]|uniref:hypothetical protein n=1 Tax=Microbulbifer taiwanensis TaxID=986746 RepID=UPI0036103C9E